MVFHGLWWEMRTTVRDPAENMLLWSPDILGAGPSLSRALPEFMVIVILLFFLLKPWNVFLIPSFIFNSIIWVFQTCGLPIPQSCFWEQARNGINKTVPCTSLHSILLQKLQKWHDHTFPRVAPWFWDSFLLTFLCIKHLFSPDFTLKPWPIMVYLLPAGLWLLKL